MRPLRLEPRIVAPLWGGTRLASWLDLPEPHLPRIGEVWQVYDDNVISDGELAGATLGDATRSLGGELIGTRPFGRYGADFPLLVKFLDTAAPLSVQVHPTDAYAHEREAATGFHGKNEAWYVVEAAPGATVTHGLVRSVTRQEFVEAAERGTLEDLLRQVTATAGQAILVRAGTIHTIGVGILLYEIQQKSDLTYRVYDFGRQDPATGRPRELHLSKALDVADLTPSAPITPPVPLADGRELLAVCESFALERWTLDRPAGGATDPGTLEIVTVIDGRAVLGWDGEPIELRRGATIVLPAALGRYDLTPTGSSAGSSPGATVLRAYVPEPA